ncbi:hypothetical protein TNCV_1972591 [Trichonephila clavipes]|nr:hypothetical protein TNCV_1972591 [Trichonephila clavipes]
MPIIGAIWTCKEYPVEYSEYYRYGPWVAEWLEHRTPQHTMPVLPNTLRVHMEYVLLEAVEMSKDKSGTILNEIPSWDPEDPRKAAVARFYLWTWHGSV